MAEANYPSSDGVSPSSLPSPSRIAYMPPPPGFSNLSLTDHTRVKCGKQASALYI